MQSPAWSFRKPTWNRLCTHALVPIVLWLFIWLVVEASLGFGPRTRFGPGLLGATIPLLLLEASIVARRRWRTRLLNTLGFAVPAFCLFLLVSQTPGSCCFCDHSPWARALRIVEFVGDFFYFSAIATLPAFAFLVLLGPRATSPREEKAFLLTTLAAVLAMLSVTVTFAAMLHVVKVQFALLP